MILQAACKATHERSLLQILEPPHASVEAVVDVLMKVDLSPAGIDALESALRSHSRPGPATAAHNGPQPQPFPGQQVQANGVHPLHQPGMIPVQQPGVQPGQPLPYSGMQTGQNQPSNGVRLLYMENSCPGSLKCSSLP